MSNYLVKEGETITDVVLNSTGSLLNWDTILTENGTTDWNPDLIPGQTIVIPETVSVDNNTQRELATYPAANNLTEDILTKIEQVFSIIYNNWILSTGFWNDQALWFDTKTWID